MLRSFFTKLVFAQLVLAPLVVSRANLNSHPITTHQEAAELGSNVARAVYSDVFDFEKHSNVEVFDFDNFPDTGDFEYCKKGELVVFFDCPPIETVSSDPNFVTTTVSLGGGPQINIRKADGKITHCRYFK